MCCPGDADRLHDGAIKAHRPRIAVVPHSHRQHAASTHHHRGRGIQEGQRWRPGRAVVITGGEERSRLPGALKALLRQLAPTPMPKRWHRDTQCVAADDGVTHGLAVVAAPIDTDRGKPPHRFSRPGCGPGCGKMAPPSPLQRERVPIDGPRMRPSARVIRSIDRVIGRRL